MKRRTLTFLLACATLTAGALEADTITLVSGKTITNVQVVSEGLLEVAYKEGRSDRTVDSSEVLFVSFDKRPSQLEDAEGFILTEDLRSAVDVLDAYVEKPANSNAFKWAPAAAAWRSVEVRQSQFDPGGVRGAASRLIQGFPDSRFVPLAYLAKADAELQLEQSSQAMKTLGDLTTLISSKSLPKRWQLECRVAKAMADETLKPESRRNELERAVAEADDTPTVKARAQVLIGESHLAEAAHNRAKAKELRAKAKKVFEEVLASDSATREALAAAHAGRGECLFLDGADADDKAALQESVLEFLRVTTLYRDQGRSVAKSLYYALRCFELMPDARRKADMKRELLALYPGSAWAAEAKKR